MLKLVRQEVKERALPLLANCWYMNWTLMKLALEMEIEVIGQIPSNRALYALPPTPTVKKRGHPKKYGCRMTADEVEKLPEEKTTIWMYGNFLNIRYRTLICHARLRIINYSC